MFSLAFTVVFSPLSRWPLAAGRWLSAVGCRLSLAGLAGLPATRLPAGLAGDVAQSAARRNTQAGGRLAGRAGARLGLAGLARLGGLGWLGWCGWLVCWVLVVVVVVMVVFVVVGDGWCLVDGGRYVLC